MPNNFYTRITNDFLEALCKIRIPGEARQVFDCIIRMTYGYNKKESQINLDYFSINTGLKKITICKVIKKLLLMNLITQKGNGITQLGNDLYMINEDFATWKPLPKKVTLPKKVITITQLGNDSSPLNNPLINLKENFKENNTIVVEFEILNKIEGFKEIWEDWIQYRKEIYHPLKNTTIKMQLKFLLNQKYPVETILRSIKNGWQGLFPLPANEIPKKNTKKENTKYDNIKKIVLNNTDTED